MEKSEVKMSETEENCRETVLNLTENAILVLKKRYLRKDENGEVIETPENLFRRVAKAIASAEKIYGADDNIVRMYEEIFYQMMANLEFIPNSPTLMNAGTKLGQLSACFVLPVEDSMESIFETLKNAALIHKSGGGTGFSFSRLRPKNDIVQSTRGISSGPISFMEVFNAATEAIKQGGTRRGANMGCLRVDHPDIMEFITCKRDSNKLTNFNISVLATDKFMNAVKNDEDFELINPRTKKVEKVVKARDIFDLIVDSAWLNGEPGLIFIDRINENNPTPELGGIESTNPCGEQPLLPYESCNLGSINLHKMLKWDDGKCVIDFEKLTQTVHNAVRFLDNVIDVNKYPLMKIEDMTKGNRKIGLGVMGFTDMLLEMGIPYDSDEAIEIASKVMSHIQKEAKECSKKLAEERGSFPNFEKSIYKGTVKCMRNATLTTVAPTGTISIIAGCSSGIEPIFAISYIRNVMDNTRMIEVNPVFKKECIKRGIYSEELMRKIAERGSLKGIDDIPEDMRRVFITAHDISPYWHIRMQAEFQKYVDNAVSKTINFPEDATREDIRDAYLLAYELGCKGITVYRDKSRSGQVLSTGDVKKTRMERIRPRPRPVETVGITLKVSTGCGNLYVTLNKDSEGLCEVFATMGKSGGCAASQIEAISRLISIALRSRVDPRAIVKQMKGIRCPSQIMVRGEKIYSCADALGKAIEKYLRKDLDQYDDIMFKITTLENFIEDEKISQMNVVGVCPDCGRPLFHEEGCVVCKHCGYSKCG